MKNYTAKSIALALFTSAFAALSLPANAQMARTSKDVSVTADSVVRGWIADIRDGRMKPLSAKTTAEMGLPTENPAVYLVFRMNFSSTLNQIGPFNYRAEIKVTSDGNLAYRDLGDYSVRPKSKFLRDIFLKTLHRDSLPLAAYRNTEISGEGYDELDPKVRMTMTMTTFEVLRSGKVVATFPASFFAPEPLAPVRANIPRATFAGLSR